MIDDAELLIHELSLQGKNLVTFLLYQLPFRISGKSLVSLEELEPSFAAVTAVTISVQTRAGLNEIEADLDHATLLTRHPTAHQLF